jgi:DNA topoisomerase-1
MLLLDQPGLLARAHADPECAAEAASLRYVSDDVPGITRRRFGKGFAYYGPEGDKIDHEPTLRRIKGLAVPPAYEQVWICPSPDGHLQATGRDARGRKQYRYHERWAQIRDAAKFGKLVAFARSLPRLRRAVRRDLKLSGLPRDKVLAACCRLLDRTCIRIGNAHYARDNGSFGLTTLRNKHLDTAGGRIRFEFTGKHGLDRELEVQDSRLARLLRRCQELPGQDLLQYLDDTGNVVDVASDDVNDYVTRHAGEAFTAKDFRTWHATVFVVDELAGVEPAASKAAINKQVVAAVDAVAEVLGNTRAVCRKCYVDPRVIAAFESGRLDRDASKAKPVRELTQGESKALAVLEA